MKKSVINKILRLTLCVSIALFTQALFAENQTKDRADVRTHDIGTCKDFMKIYIDTDTYHSYDTYRITADLNFQDEKEYVPPLFPKGFSGTFDGGYNTITFYGKQATTQKPLPIGTSEKSKGPFYGGGLFAYLDGATIKNLNIRNYRYSVDEIPSGRDNPGCLFLGSLAGYSESSTITNVQTYDAYIMAKGSKNKKNNSEIDVGGLVGYANNTTFISCASFAIQSDVRMQTYRTPMASVGGLVGQAQSSSFTYCLVDALDKTIGIYCDDTLTGESNIYYRYCAGGMVGWLYGTKSSIQESAVEVEDECNGSVIIHSYLGKADGTSGVGGLVGMIGKRSAPAKVNINIDNNLVYLPYNEDKSQLSKISKVGSENGKGYGLLIGYMNVYNNDFSPSFAPVQNLAIGKVFPTPVAGHGLIGNRRSSKASNDFNSYWDSTMSGISNASISSGGEGGKGYDSVILQDGYYKYNDDYIYIYADFGWDLNKVWGWVNDTKYPTLRKLPAPRIIKPSDLIFNGQGYSI